MTRGTAKTLYGSVKPSFCPVSWTVGLKGWEECKARNPLNKAVWVLKLDLIPGPGFLLQQHAALEVAGNSEPCNLFPDCLLVSTCLQVQRPQATLDALPFMNIPWGQVSLFTCSLSL